MSLTLSQLRKWLNVGIAVSLFIALLISLLMMVNALQHSERFEHLYSSLLLINTIALLALLALIALNIQHLFYQVQKERAGARLIVRLMGLLVLFSSVPVLIMYYFSLEFVYQRLDDWFNVNIEIALELSRATLNARMSEALTQTQTIAKQLTLEDNKASSLIALQLDQLRSESGAIELTLFADNRQIIASSSSEMGRLFPDTLEQHVLLRLEQSSSYTRLEPLLEKGLIRVIIKIPKGTHKQLLHALFPLPQRIQELANNVEAYKERAYLHKPLKISLTLLLSLVLLLSLSSIVWMALFAARRFVDPLIQLAEGTQAVARGEYEKKLPVNRLNELGFLVQSFNEMTYKIAQAQDQIKYNQQLADSQRAYLEAVLERLSSGVISLDLKLRLRTANQAASEILDLSLSPFLGKNLIQLRHHYPALNSLYTSIERYLVGQTYNWREQITLFGSSGRKILTCSGTRLQLTTASKGLQEGYVIVFDDVTTLIQAQHDAAWSGVARRLAHEIKNPLTPIQLSAERLRQKYLHKLSGKDAELLDRMTHTIIEQVEAMRGMVNAFSDYAKTPEIRLQPLNINQLITEVLDLYHHSVIPFQLKLSADLPLIEADRGHLRQVLHNLIKNALEAHNDSNNSITITTTLINNITFRCIELKIQDQGPGIPKELLEHIFEPYVTTKTKGTGLGLAIVKKIIEEHCGRVWLENKTRGACVTIQLPLKTNDVY